MNYETNFSALVSSTDPYGFIITEAVDLDVTTNQFG